LWQVLKKSVIFLLGRTTRESRLVKRSLIAALIAEPWENVGGRSEIIKKKKKKKKVIIRDHNEGL
jgi:hypothetical protein